MTEHRDDEQYLPDYAQEEPRRRMSTGMKVFLVFLGLGGLLMLVCCGGAFWFATRLQDSMTDDPAEIAVIRDGIAPVAVPDGFTPKMGMNLSLFGAFQMQMAGYGGPDENFLLLMQMEADGRQDQEIRKQFRLQAAQHSDVEEFRIESSETRTFEINGEECDFMFARGTLADSGQPFRQVTGVFPGKNGVAFLIYQVAEEEWDESAAEAIVLSLDLQGAGRRIDADADAADADNADADNADADETAPEPAGDGDAAADDAAAAAGQDAS